MPGQHSEIIVEYCRKSSPLLNLSTKADGRQLGARFPESAHEKPPIWKAADQTRGPFLGASLKCGCLGKVVKPRKAAHRLGARKVKRWHRREDG